MLLPTDAVPVARALLDAGGNAREAVFALVTRADETTFSSENRDLLAGAQAIARAQAAREAEVELGVA